LEPGKAKRASFNTRLRPSLKLALESAAKQGGRSLSEEIEFRLERSLEDQLQMGAAIGLGMSMGAAMLEGLETLVQKARHEEWKARHEEQKERHEEWKARHEEQKERHEEQKERHEERKEHPHGHAASNLVNKVAWGYSPLSGVETYSPLSDNRLKKEFPELVSALKQLREKISAVNSAGTEARTAAHNELKKRSPQPRPRKPRASGR
jgi:hypothetical protein